MLKERELLGRELHDGIGQMLAAAHLQVKAASELLVRGEIALVGGCLRRIAEATQAAKGLIREYLVGVKSHSPRDPDFLSMLRYYLDKYSRDYGIHTELVAPPELDGKGIDSAIQAQWQPIIQEALTNVRKHSGASWARVIFTSSDDRMNLTIEDNGRGFDLEALDENQGFGLRSMRGRAESMGAHFILSSTPGKGTQVMVYHDQTRSHESPFS